MDAIMSVSRSFVAFGVLIAFGFVPGPVVWPAMGQSVESTPMEVTTDTPEYCDKLLQRIEELTRLAPAPVPREVGDLTDAGRDMCEHGQTRGGIMRLRSAIMIMERNGGPAYR